MRGLMMSKLAVSRPSPRVRRAPGALRLQAVVHRSAYTHSFTTGDSLAASRLAPWRLFCVAAAALGLAGCALFASSAPHYRPVFGGDFLQHRVADGESIEVRGYGWFEAGEFLYRPDIPSAMAPARVDLARLDVATRERVVDQCATSRFAGTGGCSVVLRGEAAPPGRPGAVRTLIAHEMSFSAVSR